MGCQKMCDRPARRRQVAGAVGAVVGTWFWFNEGRRKKGTEAKQAKKTNERTSARRLVLTFWFHNKKEGGEVSAMQSTREGTQPQAQALTVTGDEISMTSISYDLAVGVLGF